MRYGLLLGAASLVLASACSVAPQQSRKPLTYVAIGASDAVGVGATNPETNGWVPKFGEKLGPDVRVVNLGVSGSTLSQALQEQLAPAVDAQPDVVTVWLAVNDFNARVPLEQYTHDLDALLGGLQQQTHARVLVGNVPDLGHLAVYQGIDPTQLDGEVSRWNQAIAQTAENRGATVVDLYSRWQELAQHPEYVSLDGFHPSNDGYARLADVFAEAAGASPSSA